MTLDEALSMLEADMDPCAAEPYVRLAADYLRTSADSVGAKPVPRDPEELAHLVASPPPQQGRPIEDVLAQVATDFVPNCNWDGLNSRLRKELNRTGAGWITLARLDGRQVLRITVMNPRTRPEDGEAVLATIARLAAHGC